MTKIETEILKAADLPSIYHDFSDAEFEDELERVHQATIPERQWLAQSGLHPYETDQDILVAVRRKQLVRISQGVGFLAISKLHNWSKERGDPEHELHYSPPYLANMPAFVLARLASKVAKSVELQGYGGVKLSVTSLTRSSEYQSNLPHRQERALAIDTRRGLLSGHQFGYDFDIDGCGLYLTQPHGVTAVNPRKEELYDIHADKVLASRTNLRLTLNELAERDVINYVEEAPDTKQHCFHIAVNPLIKPGDILAA